MTLILIALYGLVRLAQDPVAAAQPLRSPSVRIGWLCFILGTTAALGPRDVAYVRRLRRFSTAMEVTGRVLIHVSIEPVLFFTGVGALWLHKQLEATEIGHTALHGAYDGLPDAQDFASKTFRWDIPIDEESWRQDTIFDTTATPTSPARIRTSTSGTFA